MHAEQIAVEEDGTMTGAECESAVDEYAVPPSAHNIMNVLMPATPPVVKNARIIRRFDLEAAATDPRPKPEKAEQDARRREERAQRNQSLFAAAGLV